MLKSNANAIDAIFFKVVGILHKSFFKSVRRSFRLLYVSLPGASSKLLSDGISSIIRIVFNILIIIFERIGGYFAIKK